jgi:hypothetical protein
MCGLLSLFRSIRPMFLIYFAFWGTSFYWRNWVHYTVGFHTVINSIWGMIFAPFITPRRILWITFEINPARNHSAHRNVFQNLQLTVRIYFTSNTCNRWKRHLPLHKKRQCLVREGFCQSQFYSWWVHIDWCAHWVCLCAVFFTRVGRGILVHSPNLDQLTVSDDCLGRKSKKCDEKKTELGLDESIFVPHWRKCYASMHALTTSFRRRMWV